MNEMTAPAAADIGDRVVHDLMPGFAMTVEDVDACEPDGTRSTPHQQYLITDPEGNQDWLCAYDVTKVG
jgi:hypothetical protein